MKTLYTISLLGMFFFTSELYGLPSVVVAPEIKIRADLTELADGSGTFDIGDIYVGYGATYFFLIENVGNADLTLHATTPLTIGGTDPGEFSSSTVLTSASPNNNVLSANELVPFDIKALATSAGSKSIMITILSDDSDEATYTFFVTATALAKPATCTMLGGGIENTYIGSVSIAQFGPVTGVDEYEAPSGWSPLESLTSGLNIDVGITADKRTGTNALELIGQFGGKADLQTIFPCNAAAARLKGYYKYTTDGVNDKALVVVSTGGGVASNRTDANSDTLFIDVIANTYTMFQIDFPYDANSVDSLLVYFSVVNNGNTVNFKIDDLEIVDIVSPTVQILNAPSARNTSAFNVTIEFIEDVTGFTLGDITVGNGSASNFQATDGNTYTADITPDGNGDITIDVAASVAQDADGNNNAAAPQVVTTFDNVSPTVQILNAPSARNTTPFNVTIEFSEDVTGFTIDDISVGNGSASNFQTTDGNTYTADITADGGGGTLTIHVAASVAQDVAGNNNTAASQVVIIFDNTSPTVGISTATTVANTSAFSINIGFNEIVTGFTIDDITVGNGSASNFQTIDSGGNYTADITPDGGGDITIDVAASVAQDAASNNNTAATQVVISLDNVSPTVEILNAPSIVSSTTPFNVTFSFNEVVTGFAIEDIIVSNAVASNLITSVEGIEYFAEITPDGVGNITIDVPAGVAQDQLGNNNVAATQVVITLDINKSPLIEAQEFTIAENSDDGTIVGTVIASDPDGDNLTFSITAGNENGTFSLNGVSGEITALSSIALDFETIPVYTLTVQVSDGELVATALVTINLTDEEEGITSIPDSDFFNNIHLFPNPTESLLTISSNEFEGKIIRYRLYNLMGNRIPVRMIKQDAKNRVLDLRGLISGTYFISIEIDGRTTIKRISKK